MPSQQPRCRQWAASRLLIIWLLQLPPTGGVCREARECKIEIPLPQKPYRRVCGPLQAAFWPAPGTPPKRGATPAISAIGLMVPRTFDMADTPTNLTPAINPIAEIA